MNPRTDKLPQIRAHAEGANGRSVAFYIETVCVVLLLFFVLSVVLQFFGSAFVSTAQADGKMRAAATARQVAELFQASSDPDEFCAAIDGTPNAEQGTIDARVSYLADTTMDVSVTLSEEKTEAGTLYHADITVEDHGNINAMYELHTAHYVSGGAQ